MSIKLSQKHVEEQFEERGFKLLDTYINNYTPLVFHCSCGEISTISYKSLKRGSKCFQCSGKEKKTANQISSEIRKEGYKLLSKRYLNAFSELILRCPQKHEYKTCWNNWQQGRRCPKCKYNIIAKKLRHTQTEVEHFFEEQGCKLLSIYESNKKPVRYRCNCGGISHISFSSFKKGKRCQSCRIKRMTGKKHPLWIQDRDEAELRKSISKKCNSLLRRTLEATKTSKVAKTSKLLGYTSEDLRNHVESHSQWPELRQQEWHLDHIFPISAFCDYGVFDMKIINALDNLQPMHAKDNLKKNNKYNKSNFEKWLTSKGISIYTHVEN